LKNNNNCGLWKKFKRERVGHSGLRPFKGDEKKEHKEHIDPKVSVNIVNFLLLSVSNTFPLELGKD
jgi:hypothetical protein